MDSRRLGVLALLLLVAVVVAGCGGDDESEAEAWAGNVCGEVNAWVADIDSTVQSLTDDGLGLDEGDVREAAESVGEATDELAADLEELGPPETEDGQEAEEAVRSLAEALREQLEDVEAVLAGNPEPLEAVAAVATALATAASQLQQSVDALEGLDQGGELEEAFRNSDDCDELRERLADIGS